MRIAHFPRLRVPALFVHGTRDPFGTLEELEEAARRIIAPVAILPRETAGHDLQQGKFDAAPIVAALRALRDRAPQGTGT